MDYFLQEIEKHRHQFYRFVLRNVWDSALAEDVFASAVLTAYQQKVQFSPGTNFRAWMFRILANKCFQANRDFARSRRTTSYDDEQATWEKLSDEPGYAEMLQDPERALQECGDEIYRALRELSTVERSCILLRGLEDFTYREISEILDIPIGTVMTHISRGRAKLRMELLEYAKESGIIRPLLRWRCHDKEEQNKQARGGVA